MFPKAPSGEMGGGVTIERMRKCSPRHNYYNYGFYVLRNGGGLPDYTLRSLKLVK